MEKLKSRKLWVTALFGILMVLSDTFGFKLNKELVDQIKAVVMMYLGTQAGIDLVTVLKGGK